MNSADFIARLRERGFTVEVEAGSVAVHPGDRVTGEVYDLVCGLAQAIRRERHDAACACKTLPEHFERGGSFDAWLATGQSVTDHAFVAIRTIDRSIAQLACCIACGAAWESHGKPPFSRWRFVDDPDSAVVIQQAKHIVIVALAAAAFLKRG